MPVVLPLRGVRYDPERVPIGQVVAPPYDVISPDERAALHQRHSANVVRLILGEERPQDDDKQNRYQRAAAFWRAWRGQGILKTDAQPTLYVYRQQFGPAGRRWTRLGFLGRLLLEPFGQRIQAHEQTRATPKEELYRLLTATSANFSPVFALLPDPYGTVREQLGEATLASPPLYDFTDWAEVNQTLWAMSPAACARLAAAVRAETVVIADGHHRYESRLRYASWRQEQDQRLGHAAPHWLWQGEPLPSSGYWYSLTYFVTTNDPGLLILPTHRLVRVSGPDSSSRRAARGDVSGEPGTTAWALGHLPGQAVQDKAVSVQEAAAEPPAAAPARQQWFSRRVQEILTQLAAGNGTGQAGQDGREAGEGSPGAKPRFAVLDMHGRAALVRVEDERVMARAVPQMSRAWRQLDVAALHQLLLDSLLPPQQQAGEQGLEYTQDGERVASALATGQFQLAFLLPAPRPEQVAAVAAAGEKMPAKSTFFHPKLLSGLVMDDLQLPAAGMPCAQE